MDFKIETSIYDAVLTKFRAKIEGGSLASAMKMVLNEQPQGGILELEATESFWRALRLMQIARAVKKATSPHSLVVNGVMNQMAYFLFLRHTEDPDASGATPEEIAAAINVSPDIVRSGLGHLLEHGVVEEAKGDRWSLPWRLLQM